MSRSLPVLVALAVLAIAAPAQADVTASTISSPADPHFVLVDYEAPFPATINVAGTATGSGNVNIVCERGDHADLLAVAPVAANGTFALADVPVNLGSTTIPDDAGEMCRLRALPVGPVPTNLAPFAGPRLGVTK